MTTATIQRCPVTGVYYIACPEHGALKRHPEPWETRSQVAMPLKPHIAGHRIREGL